MVSGNGVWKQAALGLAIMAVSVGAHAEDLAGVWKGPWYLGMSSGVAVLRLGEGESSLQMTNNEKFGLDPMKLKDVSYETGVLRFRVKGSDGDSMTAALPVREDGVIRGSATYGGYKLRLELSRQKAE